MVTRCTRAVREAGGKKAGREFISSRFFRFEALKLSKPTPSRYRAKFLGGFLEANK